jgi:hypothetical protein
MESQKSNIVLATGISSSLKKGLTPEILSWYQRLLIPLIVGMIIIFREPSLIILPRFWAEEGSWWFSYAFSHSWIDALFSTYSEYYNFYKSFSTLLAAHIVPTEHAPLVTTIAAFFVQIIPILIVSWDDSMLWNSFFKKAVWAAIILFAPKSNEIWLTTSGSQYYMVLISILILLRDTSPQQGSASRFFYAILILTSGFSGVLSCLLTPLFFYKGWKTKSREVYLYATILLACGLIQLYVTLPIRNLHRMSHPDLPAAALIIWTRSFLAPFSLTLADHFERLVLSLYNKSLYSFVGYALLLSEIAILWKLKNIIGAKKGIFLAGGFFLMSFFSVFFAIGGQLGFALLNHRVGNRYFYVPNVFLLAMLFSSIDFKAEGLKTRAVSVLAAIFLGIALLNGGFLFFTEPLKKPNWPVWHDQITIWEQDPTYQPEIWPTGWRVRLPEKDVESAQ